MLENTVGAEKLVKVLLANKEEARKFINRTLDELYGNFLETVSEDKEKEVNMLIMFYVNEKIPKLKSATNTIKSPIVKANYLLSSKICEYLTEHSNIKQQVANETTKFNLRKSEKNVKILTKIEKLQKKNPEKAKKMFEKFTKDVEETL